MKKMNNMSFQSPMDHSYHYVDEDEELNDHSFSKPPRTKSAHVVPLSHQQPPTPQNPYLYGIPSNQAQSGPQQVLQQQQFQQQKQQQSLNNSHLSDRSFQQDVSTYNERIKQLTAFSHSKTQLAEQLQQDLKRANMENDQLQQEIELLKRECSVKQQLQKDLEKQARVEETLRRELGELKDDHNRKTSELLEIQSVQDELLKAIAENKLKLEEQAGKSRGTENEINQLTKERDRLELLVSSMENERKSYERNLMDQRRDLTEIMEQRERESQEHIDGISEKLSHYTELSSKLEEELSDARNEIDYLKDISGRAQSLEEQVKKLSHTCKNTESERDSLLTAERGYQDTISQLEGSLLHQQSYTQKLELKLDEMKKDVDTKAQHITNMKSQINQLSETRTQEKNHNELHVQSLLKILQSLKVEISKKDEIIATQKLTDPVLLPTKSDNNSENERLKRELKSCQEVISTLKNTNSKLEERLEKDHKIISALEAKLNKVKEDRNLLAEIVSSFKNKNKANQ